MDDGTNTISPHEAAETTNSRHRACGIGITYLAYIYANETTASVACRHGRSNIGIADRAHISACKAADVALTDNTTALKTHIADISARSNTSE